MSSKSQFSKKLFIFHPAHPAACDPAYPVIGFFMLKNTTETRGCSFLKLLGRMLLCVIFLLAGLGKFMDPDAISLYMASKGMPWIPFFLYATATIEVLGGVLLLTGFQTRLAASILFLFLIPVTLTFHDFWNSLPNEVATEMVNFLKNLAIMGGLSYVIAAGAGKFSIDDLINKE